MSEKLYTRLLRLYPSSFRKEYEGEALQLIRDRLRDETGFFKRAHLWWDLVADVLAGLPSAYRNSYTVTEAASLSLNAAGIPSFKLLDKEPLERGSILVGGTISLIALASFAFVLSRQIAYQPLSGSNGRMSPTESVLQRLNRAPAPDSSASSLQDAATPASAQMSEPQAQPSTPGASTPNTSTSSSETEIPNGERNRVVSTQMQNLTQDIADTWQGTLHAGKDLRTVIKITKADGGGYKATFYSIDQSGSPFPVTKITLEGSTVNYSITAFDLAYKSQLSADGKTIVGTSNQGAISLPLTFTRSTPETAWAIPEPPLVIPPMAANASPSFEVAAIKPSRPDTPGKMSFDVASIRQSKPGPSAPMPNFALDNGDLYAPFPDPGGRFTADFPLSVYIKFAYKLSLTPEQTDSMLAHLPKWVATDLFEIHAKAEGNPTKDQMRLMMQSLLADRFKLAIHFETQQVPVLALVLEKPGRTGPKLRSHSDGPPCDVHMPMSARGNSANIDGVFPRVCDAFMLIPAANHEMLLGSRNTTMKLIADSLPSVGRLGRPVVDQTGLTGRFDFTLQWTPESNGPAQSGADAPLDSQGTTFLEALKDQLGMKLKSTTAPMDVLVVDHVERPSEN